MPERVLVVDDDAPVRRMLQRSLDAEGFDVEVAADGAAALVAAERSAPDLVIHGHDRRRPRAPHAVGRRARPRLHDGGRELTRVPLVSPTAPAAPPSAI